jgi:hypothetical protein
METLVALVETIVELPTGRAIAAGQHVRPDRRVAIVSLTNGERLTLPCRWIEEGAGHVEQGDRVNVDLVFSQRGPNAL